MEPSQYTTPIVVQDDRVVRLSRVPFDTSTDGGRYNEAWLQDLLFRHPDVLPCEELDPAFATLVPLCRELSTPAGYVDLLYVTPHGQLAVVETKLWRNYQARREVVAQVLDYAKDLAAWTYEDLEREVIRASQAGPRSIYERVRQVPGVLEEAAFIDRVSRVLRTGQFMLLIVGDGIREGVGSMADFLDRFGSLQFSFGLVEVAVFDVPGLGRLVQPRILAKTAILKRTVVTIEGGSQAVVTEGTATESSQVPDIDMDAKAKALADFYRNYWTEFLQGLELDDSSQPRAKPTMSTNIFFPMPPSGSVAWVSAYFAQSKKRVGVYLSFTRGNFAQAAWAELTAESEQIEREIGYQLIWEDDGDGKYFVIARMTYEELTKETLEQITAFFASRVNSFVNAFRPRLQRLVTRL